MLKRFFLSIMTCTFVWTSWIDVVVADWWKPSPGTSWQIQYTGTLNTSVDVAVYDIDLFDTSESTIKSLHSKGKKVICYFGAGNYESWRPDAMRFPSAIKGKNIDGWPGEKWLDIRRLDLLLPIMADRIKLAATKGCDAVDPDCADGYTNDTGFSLSYDHQLAYNIALADEAHSLGLAISLKNDVEQVGDLVGFFDFAVNEECFTYGECESLLPFIRAGKPVFGIEYALSTSRFCSKANQMNFDFLRKRLDLNAWRRSCR
ncbi:MAG: endo alpha-1,4 polygalactosaminidase [Gammaproteobacteria bacterium]